MKLCKESNHRICSCSWFREWVKHYLPSIKLQKARSDLCNDFFSIQLAMQDPTLADEGKEELKLKVHLDEANLKPLTATYQY